MTAIFKREFFAYFKNPIGWVFLAIFWFFCGLNLFVLISAGVNMISYIFSNMMLVLMICIPVLTMRLMSEETRMKTDQALLTAPVSLSGIIWGKFLAAMALRCAWLLCHSPGIHFYRQPGRFDFDGRRIHRHRPVYLLHDPVSIGRRHH